MITQNMVNFIAKNNKVKIIEGERLTPEEKQVRGAYDLCRSDRVRYRFADGEKIILENTDALSAPDFKPIWDI